MSDVFCHSYPCINVKGKPGYTKMQKNWLKEEKAVTST